MTKFAIIKINNQQYYAPLDGIIETHKIEGEVGTKMVFDEVLMVVDDEKIEIGTPLIEKAKVEAELLEQKRGEKVRTFTYKAKSRHRKTSGQRKFISVIKINKITL